MKANRIIAVLCLAIVLSSCWSTSIPKRVSDTVAQLRCGMTAAEVENLSGSKLESEGQRPWGTHVLRQDTTDIWFQFNDDKLRSAQVSTLDGLMKMKLWPKKELCQSSPG